MVRKDGSTNQTLEYAEGTKTKLRSQYGEVFVEEFVGPTTLREKENDNLEDDEEAIENGPKNARRLVRYGTASEEHMSGPARKE